MSDPLEAVFLNPDAARQARMADTAKRLTEYLNKMPRELRVLFDEKFQRIDSAELAQLRASFVTLKARCDELTEMAIGRDSEIERLHNAAEALQKQVTEQARRIEKARRIMIRYCNRECRARTSYNEMQSWLSATAPQAESCTCGRGEETEPEYHAKDCAYYVDPSPIIEIPGIDYPAPQAEQEKHTQNEYREALEKIESVWVGESVKDEHLAALKMYTIAARVLNNADDAQDTAA